MKRMFSVVAFHNKINWLLCLIYRSVQPGSSSAGAAPSMSNTQDPVQDPAPSINPYSTPPRPIPTDNMAMSGAGKQDFRESYQDYSTVLTGIIIG